MPRKRKENRTAAEPNAESAESAGAEEAVQSFRDRLPMIGLLAAIFFLNFLCRFVWGPLLPAVEADLGIRHTQAGSLFLMATIGYFIGLLGSGHISKRAGHKWTVVIACLASGAALFLASLAPDLKTLRVLLVVVGTAAGIYLPSGISSLTYRLEERHWGKAFSCHEIAPSLGFVAGPLLAEALLEPFSWRGVLFPIYTASIIMGIVYAAGPRTREYRGEAPSWQNVRGVTGRGAFWIMLVFYSFSIGTNVGVYAMLPLYMHAARGFDETLVNTVLSGARVLAMGTPFIAGWANDRFGSRRVLVVILTATGLLTALVGAAPGAAVWPVVVLQSAFAVAFFPPGFAILTRIVSPAYRNLIVSLVMPAAMLLGGGALPTMIGAFGDAGLFHSGFILTGGLVVISAGLTRFLNVNPSADESG